MRQILILNGPNLNMLGQREPEIYGHQTLSDIHALCETTARAHDLSVVFRQSNHEGQLVDWIQEAGHPKRPYAGVLINAAAYTHTSVALHDALRLLSVPVIEVHLSDPHTREAFRHLSYIEPVAAAVYKGRGAQSYVKAIVHVADLIKDE